MTPTNLNILTPFNIDTLEYYNSDYLTNLQFILKFNFWNLTNALRARLVNHANNVFFIETHPWPMATKMGIDIKPVI